MPAATQPNEAPTTAQTAYLTSFSIDLTLILICLMFFIGPRSESDATSIYYHLQGIIHGQALSLHCHGLC